MSLPLFDDPVQPAPSALQPEVLEPGAMVLRGFALAQAGDLLAAVQQTTARAPWRHLVWCCTLSGTENRVFSARAALQILAIPTGIAVVCALP